MEYPIRSDDIQLIAVRNLPGASEFLWTLLLERTGHPAINISHHDMPSMKDHLAFVERHPYRFWDIIVYAGQWVGQASVTPRNEIGIQIQESYRRRGLASAALRHLLKIVFPDDAVASVVPGRFVANINPDNAASIALFKGCGAKLVQVTYQLPGERP